MNLRPSSVKLSWWHGLVLFVAGGTLVWWLKPSIAFPASAVPEPAIFTSRLLPAGVQSPLTAPTPPTQLRRLIGPWEPQSTLVVALVDDFLEAPPALHASYLELLRIGAQYLDITVMVPNRQPKLGTRLVQKLEVDPANAELQRRLKFAPAYNATFWVRDYLPQYGLDRSNRLVLLDAGNVTVAHDTDAALSYFTNVEVDLKPEYYRKLQELLNDDISPVFLANQLRQVHDWPLMVVRPPLAIDGGDFIQIGNDTVILSQSTLVFNGADEDYVRKQLHNYYHARQVLFLATLPGNTIDHLDYIMMPAGPQTLLVADNMPEPLNSKQIYARLLHQQANDVLTQNRHKLRQHFPQLRLINVPMPPIISPSRQEIIAEIRYLVWERMAADAGFQWSELIRHPLEAPARQQQRQELDAQIRQRFGHVDAYNDQDLDRLAQATLGESLDTLESLYSQNNAIYRTYLNALHLHAPDGRQAVIIPRYAPRTPEEVGLFARIEPAVMAAFREAFPQADLHWLDCDPWIEYFGAVHCITHTVPDWDSLRRN